MIVATMQPNKVVITTDDGGHDPVGGGQAKWHDRRDGGPKPGYTGGLD
jgi:hypothetical protein